MAYFSHAKSKPSTNAFLLCNTNCKFGEVEVKLNKDGNETSVIASRIFTPRDVISTIKYFTEFGGYNYINGRLDIDCNQFKVNSNVTIGIIDTSIGQLYIKKMITALSIDGLEYVLNFIKYPILARVFGYINIKNDPHYKYGLLIERVYPISEMTFEMILDGINGLNMMHKNNGGKIHGDCNPDNIMIDRIGKIKLIDPVNLHNNKINYTNVTFYENLTPHDDIRAFTHSCLLIYARIKGVAVKDVYLQVSAAQSVLSVVSDSGTKQIKIMDHLDDFISYAMSAINESLLHRKDYLNYKFYDYFESTPSFTLNDEYSNFCIDDDGNQVDINDY